MNASETESDSGASDTPPSGSGPAFARTAGDPAMIKYNLSIWSMTLVAATFLGLRIWCRTRRRSYLWWDDYVLIAAFAMFLTYSTIVPVIILLGFGRPQSSLANPATHAAAITVLGHAQCSVCIVCIAWSNTSWALTLWRLRCAHRTVLAACMASVNGLGFVFALCFWVQCRPMARMWDASVDGTCWTARTFWLGIAVPIACHAALITIILAILSAPMVLPLRFQTLEMGGVFLAGIFALGASMGGLVNVQRLAHVPEMYFSPHVFPSLLIGAGQCTFSIVAACIPIIREFVLALATPLTGGAPSPTPASTALETTVQAALTRMQKSLAAAWKPGAAADKEPEVESVTGDKLPTHLVKIEGGWRGNREDGEGDGAPHDAIAVVTTVEVWSEQAREGEHAQRVRAHAVPDVLLRDPDVRAVQPVARRGQHRE